MKSFISELSDIAADVQRQTASLFNSDRNDLGVDTHEMSKSCLKRYADAFCEAFPAPTPLLLLFLQPGNMLR